MQSRTHFIEYSKPARRFMSNQELSPLLGVCAESRDFYIEKTKTEFAFETYINFQQDIVYFRKFFKEEDGWDDLFDLEYQEVELERVDMFAELPFHDEDINDDPDAEQIEGGSQSPGNSDDDEDEDDVLSLPWVGDVKQAF
jgi:hypothetical protein